MLTNETQSESYSNVALALLVAFDPRKYLTRFTLESGSCIINGMHGAVDSHVPIFSYSGKVRKPIVGLM